MYSRDGVELHDERREGILKILEFLMVHSRSSFARKHKMRQRFGCVSSSVAAVCKTLGPSTAYQFDS
jgi:hypothetical protein